jgi:superfamily II DNA or RNA helicase
LTRKSESFADSEQIEIKKYYDETDTEILIPRFYPLSEHGHSSAGAIHPGKDIDIGDHIKPRNVRQKSAIDWLVENTCGVLCMGPGDGKTVITIKAICTLGKKAIIFVHTSTLYEQWADRFSEHTDLSRDQIGMLKSGTYQRDLDKPIVLSTVQTYVSLVNTKGKEFIDAARNANFGIAIWDECHTSVSAEQFSRSSLHTYATRTFGLSATPSRLDGNTDIINYHVKGVFEPEGESDTLGCKVIMIYFDFGLLPKFKYLIYQLYREDSNRGRFNKGVYLSKMIKSESLMKYIKQIIKQVHENNRNALVLSDRINLLDECAAVLPPNAYGRFMGDGKNGTKKKAEKRESILEKQIILATYQKGRDGFDVPRMDSIIFLTPPSNLKQAAGRVQRILEGKQQPVIIDLVDSGCKDMVDRSKYRKTFYDNTGWPIEVKEL